MAKRTKLKVNKKERKRKLGEEGAVNAPVADDDFVEITSAGNESEDVKESEAAAADYEFDDLDIVDITSETENALNEEKTGIKTVKLEKNVAAHVSHNKFDLFFIKLWAFVTASITYLAEGFNKICFKLIKHKPPVKYVKAVISVILVIILIAIVMSPFQITAKNASAPISIYSDSLIPVKQRVSNVNGVTYKWGYADKKGKIKIECQFDDADPFYNGAAFVRIKDGKKDYWRIIGTNGKFKNDVQYEQDTTLSDEAGKPVGDFNNSSKLAWVRQNNSYTFIKTNGKVIKKDLKFEYAESFSEGYARVRSGSVEWFINWRGDKKSAEFEEVKSFSEGLAAVKKNGLWGFIDTNCKIFVEPSYSEITSFKNGYACALKGTSMIYIDRSGKEVITPDFNDLKPGVDVPKLDSVY